MSHSANELPSLAGRVIGADDPVKMGNPLAIRRPRIMRSRPVENAIEDCS